MREGMDMFRLLIIPVLLVFLVSASAAANDLADYKVYYIPLEVDFYIPMTRKAIEKGAFYIFTMTSHNIDRLYQVVFEGNVVTAPVPIADDRAIRVKIINNVDGKVIFISADKGVIADNKKYIVDMQFVDNALKDIHEQSQKTKRRW